MHWKTVAWLSNIYAVVPCILICFIPESPAWLVSKGKIEQAAKSLRWINKYQPQPENRVKLFSILWDITFLIVIIINNKISNNYEELIFK